MAGDSPNVRWSAATITWSPRGYTLRIPAVFDERAAQHILRELETLGEHDMRWTVNATESHPAGQSQPDDRGGAIQLHSARLFNLDPAKFRQRVDVIVDDAVTLAASEQAEDEQRTAAFLNALAQ
jgi:hypothetical protein